MDNIEYQKKTRGYKKLKPVMKFLFNSYFKPKVIGLENIPKHDAFILCGNHTNVHDQFPIMINTDRVIHYMAKKEYFDSKMGWFFRYVAQIPVDREKDTSTAKSEALELLKDGHAIGIFPEGTRNMLCYKKDKIKEIANILNIDSKAYKKIAYDKQIKLSQIELIKKLKEQKIINEDKYLELLMDPSKLKDILNEEEYNESLLLPFKYGAVSLANKSNAYIVPFAVLGHYKRKYKDLVIKIGKPFKVSDDLEKENEVLRKKILNLLLEENNRKY